MLRFEMNLDSAITDRTTKLATILIANATRPASNSKYQDYIYVISEPKPIVGMPIKSFGKLLNYNYLANSIEILIAVLDQYKKGINNQEQFSEYDIRLLALLTEDAENVYGSSNSQKTL